MKTATKVIALTASHLALFTIAAACVAGYLIQRESRIVTQDLAAFQANLRAPTADAVRLVALLKQGQIDAAAKTCSALAWGRCDVETLGKMREVATQ